MKLSVTDYENPHDALPSPCPGGPGGAIITLVGLGHERKGYAGRLGYARGHGVQAGYVRLVTTPIHSNHPMQIRLSSICTLLLTAFTQQKDGAFYLYEEDVSTRNFDPVFQDRRDSLYRTQV